MATSSVPGFQTRKLGSGKRTKLLDTHSEKTYHLPEIEIQCLIFRKNARKIL
jgi:hypothetical protein